jgi:hypothetical protein
MDWIIRHSKKMPYHTYLNVILEPFNEQIDNYNWILTELEYNSTIEGLPVDMDTDYFILSPADFKILLERNVQIWWGVISAVPISYEITLDTDNLPYAEGNDRIWRNGNLQYSNAEIEIICFDSSYTIVKFTKEYLSSRFKNFFGEETVLLEKYKFKKSR